VSKKPFTAPWRPRERIVSRSVFLVLRIVFGAALVIWTLLPIYNMLLATFTPRADIFSGDLIPKHPTLDNLANLVSGGYESAMPFFWMNLANSVVTAVSTTALVLAISLLASYAISRLRPTWGSPISSSALVLYVVPLSFLVIPLYLLLGGMGLLNSIPGLIIALMTVALPYGVWILTQFGRDIPLEIEEAARIDGAGPLRIFFSVYIPLIKPAMVPVGMFVFLLSWNDFLYAFILLTDNAQYTIPIAMSGLSQENAPWGVLMASGVLYAIPPLALYIIFRRHLVVGITSGASKG
jgi:multiple sugar transport system permease protein